MPAGAASRYALAGGVGAARPPPAASLISASRYALGVRRSAPRALCAEGAVCQCVRLCMCRAAEPLVAALRSALGADGVGAARLGACGSLSRSALRGQPARSGAARPRAPWACEDEGEGEAELGVRVKEGRGRRRG